MMLKKLKKSNLLHFIFISLTLLTAISPIPAYSESGAAMDINQAGINSTSNNVVHKHKTPNSHRQITTTTNITNNKKILIEDSREMSPFFKLGIAINIIMILLFGRWFSNQWRENNKRDKK